MTSNREAARERFVRAAALAEELRELLKANEGDPSEEALDAAERHAGRCAQRLRDVWHQEIDREEDRKP